MMAYECSMQRVRLRSLVVSSVLVSVVVRVLAGCLVDVDESLVDRVDASPVVSGSDAGSDGSDGSDAGSDAGSSPGTTDADYAGMACGDAHCLLPAEVCCTGGNGNPDPRQGHCIKAADCQSGDYWECMGPSDCAHAGRPPVCCAVDFKGGGFSKSTCEQTCSVGVDTVILCEPTTTGCSAPTACKPSPEYTGLSSCQ
jgi:hypothetical protein